MNKKGQVFMVMLAVFTLILMIIAYSMLTNRYTFRSKDGTVKELGDLQYEMINRYAEGEAYLFYMDQSVKYSLDLSIYHLAEKGGFFNYLDYYEYGEPITEISSCGDYKGYQIWASQEKECYPNYEDNFREYFSMFFSKYMAQYDSEDPYFELELSFIDDMLNIFTSKQPVVQAVYRKEQKPKTVVTVDSRKQNQIIQSGIKILESIGSKIVPVTGPTVHNYPNPGYYMNFEGVEGPYSVHVDRTKRIMVIINTRGNIAAVTPINIGEGKKGTPILAPGNVPHSHVTPTGTYNLRKESRIPFGNTVSFGTNGVWRVLEPHWRGILLHGGRNADTNLVITHGCIRTPDSFIIAMNQHLNDGAKITIT